MATLPILGTAAAATAGTSATISPKGTLARLGLRTPSEENVITESEYLVLLVINFYKC